MQKMTAVAGCVVAVTVAAVAVFGGGSIVWIVGDIHSKIKRLAIVVVAGAVEEVVVPWHKRDALRTVSA